MIMRVKFMTKRGGQLNEFKKQVVSVAARFAVEDAKLT